MWQKITVKIVVIVLCLQCQLGLVTPGNFNLYKTVSNSEVTQTFGNVASVGANVGVAVVKKVPDLIPTPAEIFDFGKQKIAGLPFEIAAKAINKACSFALSESAIRPDSTPKNEDINYVLMTASENVSVPILNAEEIVSHSQFDRSKKTVILITGWTSDINDTNLAIDALYEAYRARGDVNFLVIDTAKYVDTLYTWSAFNTYDVGVGVATGLQKFTQLVPVEDIHLIGHSLGAHIAGTVGLHLQMLSNKTLSRITGLDPANPCFNEGEALSGLSRGDAAFVDVIHTNSKVLGERKPMGDADFYPNGAVSLQPGCLSVICAHARAWELYADTVHFGNENSLMATRCVSLSSLKLGLCSTFKRIPMGYATPPSARGNYFLEIKSQSPFGKF